MSRAAGQGVAWFAAALLAPVLLFAYRDLWAVVFLFGVAGILAAGEKPRRLPLSAWSLCAIALYLYAVFLSFFASYPVTGKLSDPAVLIAYGLIVGSFRPLSARYLGLGLFAAFVVLALDAGTGNLIRELTPPDHDPEKDAIATSRGIGLGLILLPPAALWFWRSRRWTAGRVLLILAGLAAAAATVDIYGAALLFGLGVALLAGLRPSAARRLVGAAAAMALAAPFAAAAFVPPTERLLSVEGWPDSWLHRLIIWRNVLDAWLAGGALTGAGPGAARALGEQLGMVTLPSGEPVSLISVHPHNIPIEILFEFGLIGYALFVAAALFALASFIRRPMDKAAAAAASAFASVFILLSVTEGTIWNPHFLTAGALALYGLTADGRGRTQ
ncbi:MAG: O-antigen ligase family protein [Parvularcula sp.]|nr:O-antigen ligase family protein [Parvularcula sp.]